MTSRVSTDKAPFYRQAPCEEVSTDVYTKWAQDRIALFAIVDNINVCRGEIGRATAEERVSQAIQRYMPLITIADLRKDLHSHFALRLALSATPENRAWFINHERTLLKYRLERLSAEDLSSFLVANKMSYRNPSTEEFAETSAGIAGAMQAVAFSATRDIEKATTAGNAAGASRTSVYVVPFEEAIDIVADRGAFLKNGYAYVTADRLPTVIIGKFRVHLTEALARAQRAYPQVVAKVPYLVPLLVSLANKQAVSSHSAIPRQTAGRIEIEDLDLHCARSFPPCMQRLHHHLREEHHLKHWGRHQYGLFLKGLGLTVEQSINFWRSELLHKMTEDKWAKEYLYNVRHSYGKVGAQKDYTPYGCAKVISMMVQISANEYHGCPFNSHQVPRSDLEALLQGSDFPESVAFEILRYAEGYHFQIACRKYFEAKHPSADLTELAFNHPNQYTEYSLQYWKNKGNLSAPRAQQRQPPQNSQAPITQPPRHQPADLGNSFAISPEDEEAIADIDFDDISAPKTTSADSTLPPATASDSTIAIPQNQAQQPTDLPPSAQDLTPSAPPSTDH
ncbi:DNA primase large subunit [Pelomyxa schiedti]|nr:DNA primase large subunit [Pelomyxa schiedti]